MALVAGQLDLVAVWIGAPEVNGQPPSEIVPESLVMLKLGMFWLLGEFGVMVKHQVFCSVFVDRVSVPFLGVVSVGVCWWVASFSFGYFYFSGGLF